MSSSSNTIRMPVTGSAITPTACASSGIVTSSHAPAWTRSDFADSRPSTVTAPPPTRSAALVREKPNSRASAASSRSPSSPSGTGSARTSAIGSFAVLVVVLAGAVEVDPQQGQHDDRDGGQGDRRVGEVEHREVLDLDEVDDVAPERTGIAEDPADHVAE